MRSKILTKNLTYFQKRWHAKVNAVERSPKQSVPRADEEKKTR